ncbi:FxsA family protein [Methylocapsa aurea]|uniref:FxsA family protein n=1 Tax=Methylocapsa aurea TaxID=663610 RepID=UPI000A03AF49|nr:FxsA family protein [Methylocapsa aurea]
MPLPVKFMLFFGLWLVAEFVAFALIADRLGFSGAVMLCLMTSLAGAAMLRRLGLNAAVRLRRALSKRAREQGVLSREAMLDGTLAGLGSILLILPGFVSDFAGLALAAPSIRIWVMERLQLGKLGRPPVGQRAAPKVIELAPQEWARVDDGGPRAGRTAP